jgi:hypothetical protein
MDERHDNLFDEDAQASGGPAAAALARAVAWLDHHEAIRRDPLLAPVASHVLERAVAQDWHKAGTFQEHLYGVVRSLTLWGQPDHVRLLGLLHSVYGNAYVDLVKFDPRTERQAVRGLVGEDLEVLVYRFCTISRNRFVQRLLAQGPADDGSLPLGDDAEGRGVTLAPREVAAFIVVTLADMAEQWHGWQDDIFAGYPRPQGAELAPHCAAALWPGPVRPSGRVYTLLARLASHLRHPALAGWVAPVPVFDGGHAQPGEGDEAAASALYWSVVQHQLPLTDAEVAMHLLRHAYRHFPWVGEPLLLQAQLLLAQRNFVAALAVAERGLQRLSEWGVAWDKRMSWAAWIAWGRLLVQGARAREWPEKLTRLNNLALRPGPGP